MSRRVAVVTGGSRGIGRAVVGELGRRGYEVIVAARDRDGARAALTGEGRVVGVDLSTLAGACALAAEVLAVEAEAPIEVFVHNAGLWPSRREITVDGVERAFAVNHMAPFVLNHLLEARFRKDHTRVVVVSAGLYIKGRVDVDRTPTGEDFHSLRTYADTKLANLLMLPAFARRLPSIVAVHPGVIRTDLGDRSGALGVVLRLVKRLWKSPEQGAATVVRLADRSAAEAEADSGRYFHEHTEQALLPVARDAALAEALFQKSAALAGLTVPVSPDTASLLDPDHAHERRTDPEAIAR